jgi:hypothetical protein
MLAVTMAPGLPIHRSTFFAGGNIGPALPTNLLRMDGLKRTWGILLLPVLLEALGGYLLLLVLLETLFGRQFSWWKVTLFCLPFFWFFWLIVTWCIVLLLHPLPSVLLGLFVHLPFIFFHVMATPQIVGGCWYIAVDTLGTLGSRFSSSLNHHV